MFALKYLAGVEFVVICKILTVIIMMGFPFASSYKFPGFLKQMTKCLDNVFIQLYMH